MEARSKLKKFFFGDIDDYGIVLISLLLLIFFSPWLTRSLLDFSLAPIAAAAFFVCYVLRFRKKSAPAFLDYLKLLVALIFTISIVGVPLFDEYGEMLFFIAIFLLFGLYYADRILLSVSTKVSYIFNGLMILQALFFTVYANIQASLANEKGIEAISNLEEAKKHEQIAGVNSELADDLMTKVKLEKEEASKLMIELEICKQFK